LKLKFSAVLLFDAVLKVSRGLLANLPRKGEKLILPTEASRQPLAQLHQKQAEEKFC